MEPVMPTDSLTATIPFSRAGNLIVLRAKADSIEGNFILDTGAPGLILNHTYFRQYAVPQHMEEAETGGINGVVASNHPMELGLFKLGAFEYYRLPAHRINLAHLEKNKGIKIHGLLGMQLFNRFEMIIDYANNLIHLHRRRAKAKAANEHPFMRHLGKPTEVAIYINEGKIFTDACVNKQKLRFAIDTGAEVNVIDSRLGQKVLMKVAPGKPVQLTGTAANRTEAVLGHVQQIIIGSQLFPTLPVVITNLVYMSQFAQREMDGMLGYDFLSAQLVGFNFALRKMYIAK